MRKSPGKAESYYGWMFATPWIAGLLIYYAYPLLSSFYFSFTSYSILKAGQFVGWRNYQMLLQDKLFWQSVYNTLYFVVTFVPISIVISICLSLLLHGNLKGGVTYRTLFFLPTLVPLVAEAAIWLWLLHPQFGLINQMLGMLGMNGPAWLESEIWSKPTLVIISLWGIGHTVVVFLAGLQDIPGDYNDAAAVDGAGSYHKFIYVTLPMLTPVILYNMVTGVIGAIHVFTLPYSLSDGIGAPAGSMMFYAMYLYQNAFLYLKMGYASAMAGILFVITVVLTGLIFWSSRKWAFYQGD